MNIPLSIYRPLMWATIFAITGIDGKKSIFLDISIRYGFFIDKRHSLFSEKCSNSAALGQQDWRGR